MKHCIKIGVFELTGTIQNGDESTKPKPVEYHKNLEYDIPLEVSYIVIKKRRKMKSPIEILRILRIARIIISLITSVHT